MADAADHFRAVYAEGADDYHALVAHEDASGLLWQHLDALVDWSGLDVVELGAGTGRVTVPLASRARTVKAFDGAPAMLEVARRTLEAAGASNVELAVAEHRSIPVADASADALIEGWAVAHHVDWEPTTWHTAVDDTVAEMRRIVRPGGSIVLIETLGTGVTVPTPPTETLGALYDHLEQAHGFIRSWVRTDYAFADAESARHVVSTFFGDDMLAALDGTVLPECTGIWTTTA